jgi:hypothetical protein
MICKSFSRARQLNGPLYVAGQRIKIFLALLPLRSILTRRQALQLLPLDRRARKIFYAGSMAFRSGAGAAILTRAGTRGIDRNHQRWMEIVPCV